MTLWVETLKVSHQPAKFGGHRGSGSVVVEMFLFCQMILQDHVIKGS